MNKTNHILKFTLVNFVFFSAGSSKKQERSKKTSISALLTMAKPLTVWITINLWKYQTTWPATWETYMQVRKQKLELDMEKQIGSK